MLWLCGFVRQAWILEERDNFREIPKQTEKKNEDWTDTRGAQRRCDKMSHQLKRFYLFNCDNTYKLEIVEKFLPQVEEKYGFKIGVDRLNFLTTISTNG